MTADIGSNIHKLTSLARDKTVAARTTLAEAVSDFYFDQTKALTERERALMVDILRQLIHDVEMPIRRMLAERLADQPNAPRELVVELANDQIEVAHPILSRSVLLQDPELVEIIRHRTLEHQLAITLRRTISEAVSAALVETNNEDVITSLLGNPNAQISQSTLEYLVEESRRVDRYQNPLLTRAELGTELASRMYWWVSAALRRHILDHFAVDPTKLDESLESTIRAIQGRSGRDPTLPVKPADLADQLIRAGVVTPHFLVKVLRQGEIALFEALLARLVGLRGRVIRRFLFEPGGEALSIACRAISIEKPVFAAIFLLSRRGRPGDQSVNPNELSDALAFYDRIDESAAKALLRRWQRDPDFLEAIRQLDGDRHAETEARAQA